MVIGSNQRIHALSNNHINIEIDGKSIEKVKETKSLGLVIDEYLSWTRPNMLILQAHDKAHSYQILIRLYFLPWLPEVFFAGW